MTDERNVNGWLRTLPKRHRTSLTEVLDAVRQHHVGYIIALDSTHETQKITDPHDTSLPIHHLDIDLIVGGNPSRYPAFQRAKEAIQALPGYQKCHEYGGPYKLPCGTSVEETIEFRNRNTFYGLSFSNNGIGLKSKQNRIVIQD